MPHPPPQATAGTLRWEHLRTGSVIVWHPEGRLTRRDGSVRERGTFWVARDPCTRQQALEYVAANPGYLPARDRSAPNNHLSARFARPEPSPVTRVATNDDWHEFGILAHTARVQADMRRLGIPADAAPARQKYTTAERRDRLRRLLPDVKLLRGQGLGIHRIAKRLGAHHRTIAYAVRVLEGGAA